MLPRSQISVAGRPSQNTTAPVAASHRRRGGPPLSRSGEIFGILGPNGAGKTTTVECALGLRSPDSGTIRLMGIDPQADQAQIHEITGVQLQSGAFPAKLRVGEIIDMYQSFYRHPADAAELAGALGLAGQRQSYYQSLSGGQPQRLSVLLALIGAPKVAVLDEMTTGLDPQGRRAAWELLEHIRDRGTTILLVTHFMEEAERLCDRIALTDSGRIVALDTPAARHRRDRRLARSGHRGQGRANRRIDSGERFRATHPEST